MRDNLFKDRLFLKQLAKLALPIAAQTLMLSAVGVADTLMLGGLEQNAMSAVSLATKFQFLHNMLVSTFVAALVAMGAQYWGKKDVASINKLFGTTLRLNGFISILFFLCCEFIPGKMMLVFTNDPVLIQIGAGYLRVAGWSYLLTGFAQVYLALLKISDHASNTAVISSTAVVVNILLNAVLIFGLLGAPAMGVTGAAVATVLARVVETVGSVALSFREGYIRPRLRSLIQRDRLLSRDYYRCMLPLLGGGILWTVGFTAYSAFMGHIDQDAPAANSVASSVIELVCSMCVGLATGGGILVGNALGAGDLEKGKLYGIRVVKLGYMLGIVTAALLFAVTPLIMSVVKLNDTAYEYLRGMMAVMTLYTFGRVVNTVTINGIFTAGGDTMFDFYSLAVTMWGIALPLAALGTFVFHWPVWVIYGCTCLDEVGKIPWVLFHFRKYKWVKDLTREQLTA